MTKPIIKCPKCGNEFTGTSGSEMVASDTVTGRVHLVRRYPRAECPEHGNFDEERLGHHATQWKWKFNHLFPNALRKTLFKRLSKEEWRFFNQTLHGRRRPDWELLKEWQKRALVD